MMKAESIDTTSVQRAIRERRTFKVMGDVEFPVEFDSDLAVAADGVVRTAIADAAWAPFHYDRKIDGVAEPFRFHVLWAPQCREVARKFPAWFPDAKPNNKLPSMLSACGALVLVNWLPDSEVDDCTEKGIQVNEEHLSAAAAAVQNLLVLLTAHGFGTYWSSGGQFRLPKMLAKLGVPSRERLLAAVFVEYPQTMGSPMKRVPGKHQTNRAAVSLLLREVQMPMDT